MYQSGGGGIPKASGIKRGMSRQGHSKEENGANGLGGEGNVRGRVFSLEQRMAACRRVSYARSTEAGAGRDCLGGLFWGKWF